MEVVAVIPVKPLARAKSRLAPYLEDAQRRSLVTSMLRRVVRAARNVASTVWVLGADGATRTVAREEGVGWRQEAGAGINESLILAFEEVWDAGKSPLFLPADLPFLTSEDLQGLIETIVHNPPVEAVYEPPARGSVLLSPARKSGGTNAILISRRAPFRLRLGPKQPLPPRSGGEPSWTGVVDIRKSRPSQRPGHLEDLQEYEAQESGFLSRLRERFDMQGNAHLQREI